MSGSDQEEDPMVCSADGVDWSEKVFQWEELFEGENRYERVQEFCQTIRKQLFVRIILPEEVIASYDRVGELSGEFFGYDEDTQDECIDIPEMRSIQGKLTGFTHQRFRQQYECRMTGEEVPKPIPCTTKPEGLREAIVSHYNLMEGCGRFILGVMSEGMGVNPKWFYNLLDPIEGEASETPTSPYENKRKFPSEEYTSANILRMMQYHSESAPEIEADETPVLCSDHLDVGFVTLSLISNNPCLEAYRQDKKWHPIEHQVSGNRAECMVWVGEQMDKVSNGYYKPIRHRVLVPKLQPPWCRVQSTFFLRGSPNTVINSHGAPRVKAQRPGMLRKFKTTTVKQLMALDAAKGLLGDFLAYKRAQIKKYKAEKARQEEIEANRSKVPVSTHVCESAIVSAPLDEVWSVFRNLDFGFSDMISGGELIHGDCATQIGSVHKLHFVDGSDWEIQLMQLSDLKHRLGFQLLSRNDGVNCSSCQHIVTLKPVTSAGSTFVEWTVDYSNDADAATIMDTQFKRQSDLAALQAYFAQDSF